MGAGNIAASDRSACRNREEFHEHHVTVVRLMGAPGAGMTALLEETVRHMPPALRVGAVTADSGGDRDALRLRQATGDAVAVVSGITCHPDADAVRRALHGTEWRAFDYLFIEEVRNLACPAEYDLGQTVGVVVMSAADGADVPLKYPAVFQKADLVVVTKLDLPSIDPEELDRLRRNLAAVMTHPAMLPLSVRSGVGIGEWVRWLLGVERRRGARCAIGPVSAT